MEPKTAQVEEPKHDKVYEWRVEQFETLGFSGPIAHALAGSDADLDRSRKLAKAGCSYVLMLKILM